MQVPLRKVKAEWKDHGGINQLQTAGLHFAIYHDLFGCVFRPCGMMKVVYDGGRAVERGNILKVSEVSGCLTTVEVEMSI